MANILIADDSATMRKSLAAILAEAGYTVVAQAVNGLQACIEFERCRPDLVVMDINMPYMNGIEALKSIMRLHPSTNVLMLSHEISLISEALAAGAKGYVLKPFYVQEFVNAVNDILHSDNTLADSSLDRIYSIISSL